MTRSRCCLCAQLSSDPSLDLLHAHFGGEYERRAVDVDQRLSLVPSLGSLAPGHVLLCPKRHVRSLAQLDATTVDRLPKSVRDVIQRLAPIAGDQFQLFEHGDAKDSDRVSCSVEHAHLHIVPGVPDLWPAAKKYASWQPIETLADLPGAVGDAEYLALKALSGGWRVALAPAAGHPSQLLRRIVAESIGRPTMWNWREHPALDITFESWMMLQELATR